MIHSRFRTLPSVALASGLALLAGCKEEAVQLHPVSGRVTFRGQAAAGAKVVFHGRLSPEELRKLPIPRATTDAQGEFRLSSYLPDDGAPAGEYAVTIVLPKVAASEDDPEANLENPAADEDLLRSKFADHETTPLSATIVAGENRLKPFELSTTP